MIVLDKGEIADFGHPHDLLQNPESKFSMLVKETGKSMSKNLLKLGS